MNLLLICCLFCIACNIKCTKIWKIVEKIGKQPVYCKCGEKIVKDGKNNWIQNMIGMNRTVNSLQLRLVFFENANTLNWVTKHILENLIRCGYTIMDMHSTDLLHTFTNRKYKRKCLSNTGYCYTMEMKKKDGTHTSKLNRFN